MENIKYVALSAQISNRRRLDLVANNLANLNTDAFQADRLRFKEVVTKPPGTPYLSFPSTGNTGRDLSPGELLQTGNPLDLALERGHYFAVLSESGLRYTRQGRLTLDGTGQLVTGSGLPILDTEGAPIVVPPNVSSVDINGLGELRADGAFIARLRTFQFEDEPALVKEGHSLLNPQEQEAVPAADPGLLQGYLRQSNVEAVRELTTMIRVHRRDQSLGEALRLDDERERRLVQTLLSRA